MKKGNLELYLFFYSVFSIEMSNIVRFYDIFCSAVFIYYAKDVVDASSIKNIYEYLLLLFQ